MDRQKTLLFACAKGGVGKSTVCANLALALAGRGKRVLMLDLDFGMSCLELLFGRENDSIFHLGDAIRRKISPERAFVPCDREGRLYLCPAPGEQEGDSIRPEELRTFLNEAEAFFSPDYVFLDTKGDLQHSFRLAGSAAGKAVVVTNHQPAAMRGAEKTVCALPKDVLPMLVVNCFEIDATERIRQQLRMGLLEMVDRTGAGLLGVVPAMPALALGQESGILADRAGKDTMRPFANIAARLCGESVPLFYGFKRRKKLKDSAL